MGLVLAGVLFAVGLTLALTSRPSSSFGWTAYSPLSDAGLGTGVVVLGARTTAGIVIAAAGLAGGAGLIGYALGRRRTTAEQRTSDTADARP